MAENSGSGWTYSEFARLPSYVRAEVIKGEAYETPTQSPYHQLVLGAVLQAIYRFADADFGGPGEVFIGPIDVLFGEGDYVAPDLVWIRRERIGIISDRGVEGAPDLVVEVSSPSTAHRDRGIKRERYPCYGVPHYWIIDPERRSVEVYRMLEDPVAPAVIARESFTWTPIAGAPSLEIDVPELFRDLDRMRG